MNVQIMGGGMSVQYPVNMEIAGRVCVIIGGGRVAERKAHVLLQAGAHLIVIAPALTRLLYQEASTGCFFWLAQPYETGFLQRVRPFLVFCTADDHAVNRVAAEEARASGLPAFGRWSEWLAAFRQEMNDKLPSSDDRQAFWRAALSRDIMELVKAGRLNRAEVMIRHAIIDFRPQS